MLTAGLHIRSTFRAPGKNGFWGLFRDNFSYFSTKIYIVNSH